MGVTDGAIICVGVDPETKQLSFMGSMWFRGARLNIAETLIKFRTTSNVAIVSECEDGKLQETVTLVWVAPRVCGVFCPL